MSKTKSLLTQALKFLLLASLILSSACTRGLSVDLFNNSGFPLTVNIGTQKVNIEPQQFKRILIADYKFEIHHGTLVWRYFHSLHGPQTISDAGYNILDPVYVDKDDVIRAQIDENGHIYILRRNESFPFQDNRSQPAPYPLMPSHF